MNNALSMLKTGDAVILLKLEPRKRFVNDVPYEFDIIEEHCTVESATKSKIVVNGMKYSAVTGFCTSRSKSDGRIVADNAMGRAEIQNYRHELDRKSCLSYVRQFLDIIPDDLLTEICDVLHGNLADLPSPPTCSNLDILSDPVDLDSIETFTGSSTPPEHPIFCGEVEKKEPWVIIEPGIVFGEEISKERETDNG